MDRGGAEKAAAVRMWRDKTREEAQVGRNTRGALELGGGGRAAQGTP